MENKRICTWARGYAGSWLVRTRYCGDKPCEGDVVVVKRSDGGEKSVVLGKQVDHDRDARDGVRFTLHFPSRRES